MTILIVLINACDGKVYDHFQLHFTVDVYLIPLRLNYILFDVGWFGAGF